MCHDGKPLAPASLNGDACRSVLQRQCANLCNFMQQTGGNIQCTILIRAPGLSQMFHGSKGLPEEINSTTKTLFLRVAAAVMAGCAEHGSALLEVGSQHDSP